MRNVVIRNNTGEDKLWKKSFAANEVYTVPTDNDLIRTYASLEVLLAAIASGEASIGDGTQYFTSINDQLNWLRSDFERIVTVAEQPPFSAKKIGSLKLFIRATGKVFPVVVGVNQLIFSIPFANMKFNGLEIINAKAGEKVNLKVLDTITGTVTTVPNFVLNQFGFDLNLPDGFFRWVSSYDADLFVGLQILLEYTATEERDLRVNYVIHELKA